MLKLASNMMKTKAVTIIAFVFIVMSSLIRATFFPEADIFWGARNGMDILNNGIHIFQPDRWNLLTQGEEWSPNSWLWNVLLGGAYKLFGNYGFLLLTLMTNIAAYSFLWGYLQKLRIPPLTAFPVLIGCWFIMNMFMNGRSNTADFLILAAFLYWSKHSLNNWPRLLITSFLLTVLWMNLHLTGVAAVIVFPVVVYAMNYAEELRRRVLLSISILLSALIALPLTPYGLEGLVKVSMVKNESKGLITEWSNVFFLPGANAGILFLLGVSVIAMAFIVRKKQFIYGLITLGLIYSTYDTIRLTPFLLTVILGSLAFWRWEDYHLRQTWKILPAMVMGLLTVVTLGLTVVGGMSMARVFENSESMFPVSSEALDLIPENSRAAVSQDVGSAIILFRPDVLVTLDGRNDLIGADRFVEASNILYADDPQDVSKWLEKHDINSVFVQDSQAIGMDRIQKNMTALGWVENINNTTSISYVRK